MWQLINDVLIPAFTIGAIALIAMWIYYRDRKWRHLVSSVRYQKVEFVGVGAEAFDEMCLITARRPDELASDVFRTYLWILQQQTMGKTIVSKDCVVEGETPIGSLVKDRKRAQAYFEKLG